MSGNSSNGDLASRNQPVTDDLRWCHETVQDVSRTFALTVSELDSPMSDYICVGYLLCRVADTIEDATHIPAEDKAGLLGRYQSSLDPEREPTAEAFSAEVEPWVPERPDADWQLVQQTPTVLDTFLGFDAVARNAMRPSILEMIEGMRLFIDRYDAHAGIRIQTLAELEEYSWYVAGTVGTLATELLVPVATDAQTKLMRESAEAYAHLLQFVNIATDANEDYRRENNVYVPADLLAEYGLEAADLRDPSRAGDLAPVLRTMGEHAEKYADTARSWIAAMPNALGATRAAVAVPFLLAIATIRELKSRPEDVIIEGGVKVDREEVYELLSRFHNGEPSIDALRQTIRERPLHEA
jgi:farnesyl-diphosphate farnesyltransferase